MPQITPRYFCINELTGTGPFAAHAPIVPVSRQSIHDWMRSGRWPQPVRLGRTVRWTVAQVNEALSGLGEVKR